MAFGNILIVGCGYVGSALAKALMPQAEVTGWVHSPESAANLMEDGIAPWVGDASDPAAWEGVARDFAAIIHCASSNRGGAEAYRAVYLEGMRRAAAHLPRARLIFVSSTSVYGQADGSVVTEESPAEPATETGAILREAEETALAAGGTVLRIAGIYGPRRGVLLRKFLAGEAVIEGDGLRWINQAHRDDIVEALLRALDPTDPLPAGIYNVADDLPISHLDYYRWLAERTGHPLPPFGPVNRERKRGLTDKRVSNAKLRATGWHPSYPTFREGLDAELKAL